MSVVSRQGFAKSGVTVARGSGAVEDLAGEGLLISAAGGVATTLQQPLPSSYQYDRGSPNTFDETKFITISWLMGAIFISRLSRQ